MENQKRFQDGLASDRDSVASARAGLDVLRASSQAARIEGQFPQTPLWYGVALATTIGGFTMFNADDVQGRWIWLLIGSVAAIVMSLHYFRTVAVVPRRSKQTVGVNLLFMGAALALTVVWGIVVTTSGEVLVGRLIAVWLVTTAVLVGMVHAMNLYRARALAA